MTSKEQQNRNLAGFIEMLKTSGSDVGSFRKGDVSTYFLMLRKFFKNYVNENNEKYSNEHPLHIHTNEAENIYYFFNAMIEIFEKSHCIGFIHEMTVLDKESLKQLSEYQYQQHDAMQEMLRRDSETVSVHNARIEDLLNQIGMKR